MSDTSWSKEFDTLEEAIAALEQLKGSIIFGAIPDAASTDEVAEQHLLAAHAALDTAKTHMRLAEIVLRVKEEK